MDPPGNSLESRLTMPGSTEPPTSAPPVEASPAAGANTETTSTNMTISDAQVDGAASGDVSGSLLPDGEYDVEVKLSDLQQDPNNPLFSAKSFEELQLPEPILKGIYNMNFRKPSKIQEKALPLLLSKTPTQNMIGQSQSGTGKTAAFVINILARCDYTTKQPQALVLAPSRELARQILGVIQVMGQFLKDQGLQVVQAVPDPSQRGKKLEGQIVVGTPGTVMDLIRKRLLDARGMKVLVLDEADNMLDLQGLGDQCKRVKNLLPPTVQVVLFSATFAEHVVTYASSFAPKANILTLKHEELTVDGIKQLYMDCNSEDHKFEVLVKLYGLMTIGSSIIFVRRRDTAVRIEQQMVAQGHKVASLTGALEGRDRDAIIDSFRSGHAKVLITTNVLSRGIDVQSVSMVINYDIPDNDGVADPDTYLHRIGRTGRFGRVGVAISFVYDRNSWRLLMDICQYFNVAPIKVSTDDWDEVEDQIKKVLKSSRAGTNLDMSA